MHLGLAFEWQDVPNEISISWLAKAKAINSVEIMYDFQGNYIEKIDETES